MTTLSRTRSQLSRVSPAVVALAAIAVVLLFLDHRAHALGALPYLLLLACPAMHFLMHRGHGHGHDGRHAAATSARVRDPVCGMEIDPEQAAGFRDRGGKTFYFCSERCLSTFDGREGPRRAS